MNGLMMGQSSGNLGGARLSGDYLAQAMAAGAIEARQEPEILRQAVNVEHALQSLHKTVEELEQRLCTVLRATPPTAGTANNQAPHPVMNTPLGERLHAIASGAANANERLQYLMSRLEV